MIPAAPPPEIAAAWPLAAYGAVVLVLTAATLLVSHVLGEKRTKRPVVVPYEAGVVPTGSTHIRISVGFYLVALSFLIFDLEAAFVFAWAVAAREVGWRGYLGLLSFVLILLILLIYEWKTGALDWGPGQAGGKSWGRSPTP